LKRIKEGNKQRREDSVSGRDQREEEDSDRWGPPVGAGEKKRKEKEYRFG
jgi:hypothetical protein